jgi:hypothetical protein
LQEDPDGGHTTVFGVNVCGGAHVVPSEFVPQNRIVWGVPVRPLSVVPSLLNCCGKPHCVGVNCHW